MATPRLMEKVAIVTGAASGFGEGIARRFAAEGCAVLVNDMARDSGERVAADILGGELQLALIGPFDEPERFEKLLAA